MSDEKNGIITTKEAAKLLDVKPSTIHKYVKEGKLKPVYENNWHIDATKLFYVKDIEQLKNEFVKPGITTGEASELLGLHLTTISQYIQKGELKAEKKLYKGREIYFIEREELERFKNSYEWSKKKEQKEFLDKETGYAWFQCFSDSLGRSENRILLDEGGEPFLFTSDSRKIPLNKIKSEGYQPTTSIADIDYISKRGYAKFKFMISDLFFSVVDLFYKNLGPKNMKMSVDGDEVVIEIKPVVIRGEVPSTSVQYLENNIIEGGVSTRVDGVIINSDLETITVAVPSELKERIKREAELSKNTIEEVVLKILTEKLLI